MSPVGADPLTTIQKQSNGKNKKEEGKKQDPTQVSGKTGLTPST